MIKEAKNKAITASENKNINEQVFLFPDYQISITASSQEEAEKKLSVILKDRAK